MCNYTTWLGGFLAGALISTGLLAAPLITVATNAAGERIYADSIGKTLYVFDPDQGRPAPVCVGTCAEDWPPYLVTAEEATTLAAPLATITRTNNRIQLTIDGRPVYTYIFDRVVGDDLGDGLGGVWHDIVAP